MKEFFSLGQHVKGFQRFHPGEDDLCGLLPLAVFPHFGKQFLPCWWEEEMKLMVQFPVIVFLSLARVILCRHWSKDNISFHSLNK